MHFCYCTFLLCSWFLKHHVFWSMSNYVLPEWVWFHVPDLKYFNKTMQKSSIIFPPSCNMDYHLFALLRRCLESAIILGLTSWRFLSDAMAMTWNVWILCHASPPDFASLWFAIAYMYNPIIRVNHVVPKAYLNGIVSKSTCKKAGNKCLSTRRVS